MLALWLWAAVAAGASMGLLGVYVVGFRMPLLAVALSHAAMAGAVGGVLAGWDPLWPALATALAAAGLMAALHTGPARTDLGTLTSIFLSLTMGLIFLGMGLNRAEMSPILGLLSGSMLLVSPAQVWAMTALTVALGIFIGIKRRALDALLFSPRVARSAGVGQARLMAIFMVLAALVITLNLQMVGGLMIYSLLTCPAAAAYEIARNMGHVRTAAVGAGVVATVGGLAASYWLALPTGACIVLVSTALWAAAAAGRHRRTRHALKVNDK